MQKIIKLQNVQDIWKTYKTFETVPPHPKKVELLDLANKNILSGNPKNS